MINNNWNFVKPEYPNNLELTSEDSGVILRDLE